MTKASRDSPRLEHEICILAGGLSQRMGRDKSQLRLGSRSMVAHIRAIAKSSGASVRVIRRDAVPRCGPVGAIFTALKTTRSEAVLFLACDMPFITTDLIKFLLEQFDACRTALFVRTKGLVGFPFILRRSALAWVAGQIDRGEFSLQTLAKILEAKVVRLPAAWRRQLANVNTPADWEQTCRRWSKQSDARASLRTKKSKGKVD